MPLHRLDLTPTPNRLGEALGTGLEYLAHHKLNQLQRNQGIQRLQDFGLSPQEAAYANSLPAKEQFALVNQLAQSGGMAGNMNPMGQMAENMNYNAPTENVAYSQNAPLYNEPGNEFQRNALINALGGMAGIPQGNLRGNLTPTSPQQNRPLPGQNIPSKKPLSPLEKLRNSFSQKEQELMRKETIKQQLEMQKEAIKQANLDKQQQAKLQVQIDKETLPFFNEVIKEDKAAKDIDLKLKRMNTLIEKGKLPDPIYYKQLKDLEESLTPFKTISGGAGAGAGAGAAVGLALGGPVVSAIGSLIGGLSGGVAGIFASRLPSEKRRKLLEEFPDTEEFEKLSASFISGAKAIFGSRVTDQDLRAFMQTVPQLSNTEAGKKAIIKNIDLINQAAHAKAEAMKRIIRENGGKRPANLQFLVEEAAGSDLDKIAKEFIG